MPDKVYRNTTLGLTLQETLDESIQNGQITHLLAYKVLVQFESSMNNALAEKAENRLTFKADKLENYKLSTNVWTFVLSDVEFREMPATGRNSAKPLVKCATVKIVARESKTAWKDAKKKNQGRKRKRTGK